MKFSKLDLLTLLISLFLFSSCKNSSNIGLDIDPSNAIKGILLDTVTVTSRTLTDIPTSTYSTGSGMPRYPLGTMTDDVFGTTTASVAMSVNLPGAAPYSFGTNPVIDSVILVLPYQRTAVTGTTRLNNEFYGDSTAVYSINVKQLDQNLSTQSSWLSNKTYVATDLLGTFTGSLKPNTRVSVVHVISAAKDTVFSAPPQIRIKLDASKIKTKILDVDSLSKNTDIRFNNIFRGLQLTASATKKGGIAFLDFSTATEQGIIAGSNIEIYYKKQGTTTALRDTAVVRFPIYTSTNPVAATITHNYAGTPVATQLNTPGEYQTTYLQAMGGLRNKITFPYLKTLVAKIGSKIAINRAELVVDISDAADSIPFKIPQRLALYRYDIAEQRQQIPDNNPYNSSTNTGGDVRTASTSFPFGGFYDSTKKSYTFNVTNYVQDLIDGKTIDYGTYLAPTSGTEFNVFPFPTTAGRGVIGSFNNTSNRKIRLNIYYVKASQ